MSVWVCVERLKPYRKNREFHISAAIYQQKKQHDGKSGMQKLTTTMTATAAAARVRAMHLIAAEYMPSQIHFILYCIYARWLNGGAYIPFNPHNSYRIQVDKTCVCVTCIL